MLNPKNCPFAVEKRVGSKYTKLALAVAMGLFAFGQSGAYAEDAAPVPPVVSPAGTTYTINNYNASAEQGQGYAVDSAYNWSEVYRNGNNGYVDKDGNAVDGNAYYIPVYNEQTGQLEDHYYVVNIVCTDGDRNERYNHNGNHAYSGDLVGHYVGLEFSPDDNTSNAIGAGIYNNIDNPEDDDDIPRLNNIVGDFIENTCNRGPNNSGNDLFAHGGGLDNHGIINNVIGDFIGNKIYSATSRDGVGNDGAALRNGKIIGTVKGNFIGNEADAAEGHDAFGGAIANHKSNNDHDVTAATIGRIEGAFISNKAKSGGGAIYNDASTIQSALGYFMNNETTNGGGGAVYNANGAIIQNMQGLFIANKAATYGGAIYNTNNAVANISGDFILNSAKNGGAVYNDSVNPQGGANLTIDGNFVNNTATEHGGAIYSKSDIDLLADGHTNVIKGNTANGQDEAIYMEGTAARPAVYDENDPTQVVTPAVAEKKPNLNLITNNGGRWIINDSINGTNGLYNVNMNGGGTVSLYNDINGGNVYLNDGTTLDTVNNEVHTYNVNEFTVTGDSSMKVDVDIQSQTMDRIATADGTNNYGDDNGNGNVGTLNVDGFHFINDSKTGTATILFAEEELAKNVLNNGKAYDDPDNNNRVITPARIYDIGYSIHSDNRGYFEFSNQWNPAILAAPVVLQAGVQSAMNTTMLHAFNHLDTYTKIPKFDRLTMMNNQNRYALSTDFNDNNSPLRQYNLRENRTTNEGVWLRPYAMFESIPLKNGPKVDSITYGSFLGYDSDFREHRHGWHSVWSTYLGYQGGQLDFRGVSANLNGGVLGITDTFYKGNFWTAMTLTGGAMNADISTMYGHEDSVSIYGGIASKTGYNFEFKDGKYILQPIMLASYTFANMLDYKNAAGVKVDANTMHTIQMNPSLRFITNLKNGWQPYARVGMVWNFLNETDMNAYGYHLPDMHIKPYVEYGLGIQKLYNHRFTGFAQAMMRNGGRNGVAITLGFRYALGREGNDEEFSKMTPWEKFKAFFK